MKIEINNTELNVETVPSGTEGNIPVIFLHGFSGSLRDWQFAFDKLPQGFTPYTLDIVGHGRSSSPAEVTSYSAEAIVEHIRGLINFFNLSEVILTGYSMGGRAALSFAVKYPELLKGLILESATAGIIDEVERRDRRNSDFRLADFIEGNSIEAFVDYWMDLPLFESQKRLPEELYAEIRQNKMKNSKTGLANSLRGFSTGVMPQLWDELGNITCKTLLISGGLDKKFTEISRQMSLKIKRSKHEAAGNAGHNIHLERPEFFLNLLNGFLMDLLF